jgi:hypothetical protein
VHPPLESECVAFWCTTAVKVKATIVVLNRCVDVTSGTASFWIATGVSLTATTATVVTPSSSPFLNLGTIVLVTSWCMHRAAVWWFTRVMIEPHTPLPHGRMAAVCGLICVEWLFLFLIAFGSPAQSRCRDRNVGSVDFRHNNPQTLRQKAERACLQTVQGSKGLHCAQWWLCGRLCLWLLGAAANKTPSCGQQRHPRGPNHINHTLHTHGQHPGIQPTLPRAHRARGKAPT